MMTSTALVKGREARSALPARLTIASGRQHTAETILRAWFEGKAEHTIRSYRHDLADFALYLSRALGVSPPMGVNDTLTRLFKQSAPSAHEVVLGFRGWMLSAHLSAASVNRHLATLRSVSKLGRMLGMMTWYLEVPGVKAEKRRNTMGPAVAEKAGLGLDKIRAHSRHSSIATLMLYVDEHDRQRTQQTLADLVAGSLAT
jgi:hypothetical protein